MAVHVVRGVPLRLDPLAVRLKPVHPILELGLPLSGLFHHGVNKGAHGILYLWWGFVEVGEGG